jgi:hypothetical protein
MTGENWKKTSKVKIGFKIQFYHKVKLTSLEETHKTVERAQINCILISGQEINEIQFLKRSLIRHNRGQLDEVVVKWREAI